MPSDDDIQQIEQLSREMRELAAELGTTLTERPADEPPLCSFCDAGRNNVKAMFEGRNARICSDCIKVCQDLLHASK